MRTTRSIAGLAGITVAATIAALGAPGAMAADEVSGDVQVTNTETVSVRMSPTAEVKSKRVYEQLVLSGRGKVDIANPVSTTGLRNLDGFGGWEVVEGVQRVKTTVSGEQKYRSVSTFDQELPVSIKVEYWLDDKPVEPKGIVGKSGDFEARFTVRNLTGKQQQVTYTDGEGNPQSATHGVVIPMVGSFTTTLPSSFRDVVAEGANAAGDGKGGTTLSFTMTLFPPIGADRTTFGYTAKIKDGEVPAATATLLPVDPFANAALKAGAENFSGGVKTATDLTAGAVKIDENLLTLRDGASDLVDGLIQLRDGANKLSAGASTLDGGLSKAAAGGPALLQGVADLKAGALKIDKGLVLLNEKVGAGAVQFKATFGTSVDGAMGQVSGGIGQIIAGYLDGALTQTANAIPDEATRLTLLGQIAATKQALQGVQGSLTGQVGPALKQGVNSGVDQLAAGVSGGVGSATADETLRNGIAQVVGGLSKLQEKGGELADGLNKLSSGAGQLNAGAGQLADGLQTAAEKAPAIPEGAQQLSELGTSQLANLGNGAAMDFGQKVALIEAGAARAADAQPYGSPAGAQALTAYKFELAAETGEGSANLGRGLGAAVLLALGLGALAVRRRVS